MNTVKDREEQAMTHNDEGNYRAKRGGDTPPARAILDAVKDAARDEKITCAAAFGVAVKQSVSPAEMGRAIDFGELKISKCQLGLFGYGKGVKLVKPAETVPADLEKEIREALEGGSISCQDVWGIADRRGMARLGAACACEKLGIKISKCQLGAF